MNIKKQTPKDASWVDESGIPYNRTTAIERKKERYAYDLALAAAKINLQLSQFKDMIRLKCQEIYQEVMADTAKPNKGTYTWFNFDASIKIEVQVNQSIDFDGLLIEKCKQKLMELISENISSTDEFIKGLIMSAFETSKGKLDTKKVLGLKKHASRIKDARYSEAMDFLDQSIRRPESKTYFRVWVKNSGGQYQSIDLNFSSI